MKIAKVLKLVEQEVLPQYLNPTQKLILQQVWQGRSYREIAAASGYDYGYIKDTGAQIWRMLSPIVGHKITKSNVRSQLNSFFSADLSNIPAAHQTPPSELPILAEPIYGRETATAELQHWISHDQCHLISINGIGGVGKTSLAANLTQNVAPEFEYVIWRSVRHAPSLTELLSDIILFLSERTAPPRPPDSTDQISILLDYLRQRRCLIVLDNLESVLQTGSHVGTYRHGYGDYGELLASIADTTHQSCLVITSREQPGGLSSRIGASTTVKAFKLQGLDISASQTVINDRGLDASSEQAASLAMRYSGHPLALKIVTATIRQIFGGNIAEFLDYGTTVFGDLWDLLDQQFQRLSSTEQQVMYWLAINREWADIAELRRDMIPTMSPRLILEAVESLNARSLIEITPLGIRQQPMVMEYMTERLINQFYADQQAGKFDSPATYPMMKVVRQDFVRES